MTRKNVLQQSLLQANMESKEYELSALRNQMNPHFVFNSLNAIQNFIFKNDSEKANYYLSIFSRLMRDSLKFSRMKYIPLQEEINFLRSYLELEQMRFPNRFDYQIVIDEDIPTRHYSIPTLLFQPVLENVVKHAFKEINYKGVLEIKIEEAQPGEVLAVRIQDNGSGLDADSFFSDRQSKTHQSLGLTIIKNQIDLLNSGNKEKPASFQIVNLKDIDPQLSGVRVDFSVPIKSVLHTLK